MSVACMSLLLSVRRDYKKSIWIWMKVSMPVKTDRGKYYISRSSAPRKGCPENSFRSEIHPPRTDVIT